MNALVGRLREALREGGLRPADPVVIALSGGMDSVVLLHLLRFEALEAARPVAAHLDHAMRATSGRDARWVAGLCRAWRVELHTERASAAPESEEAAREIRYAFLERVRAVAGARWVLTAHHADDQAETVLFRALRGTGRTGLAGIPARREPGIWRPLLGFWREELVAYARSVGLSWREDTTNAHVRFARNALRGRILPEIERHVAPRARRSLVRMARLAREDEAGWQSVLPMLMAPLAVSTTERSVSLDRAALADFHPAVRARLLRAIASDLGARLDEEATRRAVDFALAGASGKAIELGGAWSLARELDRLVLRSERTAPRDEPLLIADAGPGAGEALLGGERVRVAWGGAELDAPAATAARCTERFDPDRLRFPLTVRAREAGDKIRLREGTKKVKKLFLEQRVPGPRRDSTPLVVDAAGDVLWIPEVARSERSRGHASPGALTISIR